jgi:hypothetical protein
MSYSYYDNLSEEEIDMLYKEFDKWYMEHNEEIALMEQEYQAYLNDEQFAPYFNEETFDIAEES